MSLTFLGSDLVESIRNVGMVPDTGATGVQDVDLLRAASEGIREYLVAKIQSAREEYFVLRSRTTLVPGTARYRIPPRAMWQRLRGLNHWDGANRQVITPADPDEIANLAGGSAPSRYIIEGNDVVLIPDLGTSYSGSLEFAFLARPGDLVMEEEARQISALDALTKTITFTTTLPTGWASAARFDVHSEHSGAELKGFHLQGVATDIPLLLPTASQIVLTDAIDGSVFGTKAFEVGDWVCLENEAALPGVPAEFHSIVARVAAMKLAESIADKEKFDMHSKTFEVFLRENLKNLEQRVESKPWRITGRRGLLGRGRLGRSA